MNSRGVPCSPTVHPAAVRLLAGVLLWIWAAIAQANPADLPDFAETVRADADRLAMVTSDKEALAFFAARISLTLGLEPILTSPDDRRSAGRPIPDTREFSEAALHLVTDLAAWQFAASLSQASGSGPPPANSEAAQRAHRHRAWVLAKSQNSPLHQALALSAALDAWSGQPTSTTEPPPGYEAYAAYLDRTYPHIAGSESSWTAVAAQEGSAGLRRRLEEAWNGQAAPPSSAAPSDASRQAMIARYAATRLRPVLAAQAHALARQAQAEAERDTLRDWIKLRAWSERVKTGYGLAKLCGTWQWSIHNHQNHQDHKAVIVFPPPDAAGPLGAVPQKILIMGEAVYLRWEFQGGVQEDSLLLSGGGQRLEGTFVNSAGAWGSITGKRTGACGQ